MNTQASSTPTLLVTGATGTIGSELINLLSARGIPFRAMVRSVKDAPRLAALPGAQVVQGDFNDPASLAQALQGIEQAFLLTNSSEQAEAQQLAFVDEARKAGVRHLVKLSQLAADKDSPVRFLRYHALVEEAVRDSGMAYTFLRPNLFMQGLLGFKSTIVEKGMFFAAVGKARISLVDIRDIAAVAAAALTEPGHENRVYTLTGPHALTHAELAETLSGAIGKKINFVDVPPAVMLDALLQVGFPAWQAEGLIEDYAHYSRNEAAEVTDTVERVTGQAPRNFEQFARDFAPVFANPVALG